MKSVLVTGGAGYVGTESILQLRQRGYQVTVVDSLFRGFVSGPIQEVDFYQCDLTNADELEKIFRSKQFDVILHLAALALVAESSLMSERYLFNNIQSTKNLLHLCDRYHVKRFILASSSTVYGNANGQERLSEVHRLEPINPYGVSKLECEKLLTEFKAMHPDFNYSVLRYFNVAGANLEFMLGQRTTSKSHIFHVLADCALKGKKLLINGDDYHTSDGTCVRDYIHVQDVGQINRLSVDYLLRESSDLILNCGYGAGLSVRQAAELFMQVNQVHIEVEYAQRRIGDPDYLVADNSLLKSKLGWQTLCAEPMTEIARSAYLWEKHVRSTL